MRRYLVPELGRRKLERLTVQDVRGMLTRLQYDCRCCRDGIDAARTPDKQHCCAVSNCCRKTLSVRSIQYIHAVLRAGLQQAMREDLVMRNVAKLVQAPNYRVDRGLTPLRQGRSSNSPRTTGCTPSTSWLCTSGCAGPSYSDCPGTQSI